MSVGDGSEEGEYASKVGCGIGHRYEDEGGYEEDEDENDEDDENDENYACFVTMKMAPHLINCHGYQCISIIIMFMSQNHHIYPSHHQHHILSINTSPPQRVCR